MTIKAFLMGSDIKKRFGDDLSRLLGLLQKKPISYKIKTIFLG
jgi:hypothetical protein